MPRPRNATPAHAAPTGVVRIVGGRWRGTRLAVADLPGLRPTADRVRETLFNWLQPVLPGARVLDLFAGSGALGLEAVSRGAAQAVLVERDAALAEALHATARRLDAGDAVQVVRADALAWLRAPLFGRFDVAFVDPPFADAHWERVLEALPPWLADTAWLYLETPVEGGYAPGPAFQPHREGRTRQARYALYRHVRPAAGPATLAAAPTADGGS